MESRRVNSAHWRSLSIIGGAAAICIFAVAVIIIGHGSFSGVAASGPEAAPAKYSFDIPQQPLARAIAAYSAATGMQILYTQEEPLRTVSAGVAGNMTADEALARLLRDTDLTFRHVNPDAVTLEHVSPRTNLVVQGTHTLAAKNAASHQ